MIAGGSAPRLPRRVCFFGTYPREYTVTQSMRRAVADAAIEVIECHEPLWERQRTKHAGYFGVFSLIRLLREYVRAGRRLRARLRDLSNIDAFVVGFQGQLDLLLLRRLQRQPRVPVLFAPLVTLTETLLDDRRVFSPASPQAGLLRLLDRASLRAATRILIDTQAHAEYLQRQFAVSPARCSVWYLGCDRDVFQPQAPVSQEDRVVRILFYGSFLPLHGVSTILAAAALLQARSDIRFTLCGEGVEMPQLEAATQGGRLPNVTLKPWQDYRSLPFLIAQHHVSLGIFGTGPKAAMVIPNKVYQAAAVGRAIITADTRAAREVFTHGKDIWLCPAANSSALAEAIQKLADDPNLRSRLADSAAQLMATRFAAAQQAQHIASILSETMR